MYEEVKNLLESAHKILIISHRKPDADTLGAALCLQIWLEGDRRKVVTACIDKPSKVFKFLPRIEEYVDNFELKDFDLLIIVDAGASYMTDFHKQYPDLFKFRSIINIDHHASNDHFGTFNIVDPAAASTTVILYRMFENWGVTLDSAMATCLLAGIYSDTGAFMHSNTDKEVYEIAAALMQQGACVAEMSKALFKTKSLSTLRLWGKVLEKAYITDDNVVMSVIKDYDYNMAGAHPEQLSGVIDYLNMIPDTKFAVLLNEDQHGNVRGSFRTQKADIDLSRIAKVFGGGGHPKASGFMMPGRLKEELRYNVVLNDKSEKPLNF